MQLRMTITTLYMVYGVEMSVMEYLKIVKSRFLVDILEDNTFRTAESQDNFDDEMYNFYFNERKSAINNHVHVFPRHHDESIYASTDLLGRVVVGICTTIFWDRDARGRFKIPPIPSVLSIKDWFQQFGRELEEQSLDFWIVSDDCNCCS